jgi:xanthine dehydrogenase molybdopterin-binding subunit B
MPQHQPGNNLGITSKTKATAASAASSGNVVATPANYASETAINARLTAISATTYSAANLDKMTLNDKIYALRLNDDAGTI